VLRRKIEIMDNLKERVTTLEKSRSEIDPDNPNGETAIERLDWAINLIEESHACGIRLLD
jgi:hypothetical protein